MAIRPLFFFGLAEGCEVACVRPTASGPAAFSLEAAAWFDRLLPVLPSLRRPVRLRLEPRPILSAGPLAVAPLSPVLASRWSLDPGTPSVGPATPPATSCPLLDPVALCVLIPSPGTEGSRDVVRGGGATGCAKVSGTVRTVVSIYKYEGQQARITSRPQALASG